MTVQGIVLLDVIGFLLLLWVLNQVRLGRLYVGYGIIFVFAIPSIGLLLSVPKLLAGVTHMVGAIFPTSALTLLALCFIVFLLVYILTQITLVSNRLAIAVQELAILRAREATQSGSIKVGDRVASVE